MSFINIGDHLQIVNPKLSEMASRCGGGGGGYGGGKGRWGYGGAFKGRENNGPRSHTRFSSIGGGKSNGYHNGGGCKLNELIFKKRL